MKLILVILLLLSTQIIKSQNVMSNRTVFENFVMQINEHNAEGIANYLSDSHVYTDAQGKKLEGKDNVKAAWEKYFKMYLEYKITITDIMENGAVFMASGTVEFSIGSTVIPAAWKAEINNGKIDSWQMFADITAPSNEMTKTSQGVEEENKVLGFGGVFFKAKDAKALCEWYNTHLGTSFGKEQYMNFKWRKSNDPNAKATTTFGIFSAKTKYFDPSTKDFMFNFRVKNLKGLIEKLKSEGVTVVGDIQEFDYGNFGWIVDMEGNKIELWEPNDSVLEKYEDSK